MPARVMAALLAAAVVGGCATGAAPSATPTGEAPGTKGVEGNWSAQATTGEVRVLFYKGGELAWNDAQGEKSGSWRESGAGELELTLGEERREARYTRSGDRLTLEIKPSGPVLELKKD